MVCMEQQNSLEVYNLKTEKLEQAIHIKGAILPIYSIVGLNNQGKFAGMVVIQDSKQLWVVNLQSQLPLGHQIKSITLSTNSLLTPMVVQSHPRSDENVLYFFGNNGRPFELRKMKVFL
mmetsp:Transcript_21502/g.20662  ORF Transcript_21502/g.20662 Transcript_21502/m.20662 type:complete len:119 (+) Transcript_21502:1333-1689(+)